ncbi:MAG: MotA/TolQ/ExbB proton channel family protein [Nitrospirae bacterium]|nr:MotA/TolQ/ExbB proton channel family protein [Nitrospirota bacterium]
MMNIVPGAVITISLVLFALTVFRDIGLSMIFNLDAFLIVAGGTAVALCVGFPFLRIRNTIYDIIQAYSGKRDRDSVVKDILDISRTYMRTSIRSLEHKVKGIEDDFLRLGARLLINNYGDHDIKNILEREMTIRLVNRDHGMNLLKTAARLTPSFGLAGTVISLIKMFRHMESVDTIAPMMAVALMSTFYGVIISNLIMLPLSAKLKEQAIESELIMNITIEGILAIKNMEHPLKIEERIRGCREEVFDLPAEIGKAVTAQNV